MFKERRCHECGTGTVRPEAKAGRFVPYRDIKSIEVPAWVPIPTCDTCGSQWIDPETAHVLDEVLELAREQLVNPPPPEEMAGDNVDVDPKYLDPNFGLAPVAYDEWIKRLQEGDGE